MRAQQLGQKPRRLQLNAAGCSAWQLLHRQGSLRVRRPHGSGKLFDFAQIFGHLIPVIPVRVIRIDMEERLIGTHAVLHVHLHQYLIDVGKPIEVFVPIRAVGMHEGEKEWIVVRVSFGLLDDTRLVLWPIQHTRHLQ